MGLSDEVRQIRSIAGIDMRLQQEVSYEKEVGLLVGANDYGEGFD
jgi:hypothetical protein